MRLTSYSRRSASRSPKARSSVAQAPTASRGPHDEILLELETDKASVEIPSPSRPACCASSRPQGSHGPSRRRRRPHRRRRRPRRRAPSAAAAASARRLPPPRRRRSADRADCPLESGRAPPGRGARSSTRQRIAATGRGGRADQGRRVAHLAAPPPVAPPEPAAALRRTGRCTDCARADRAGRHATGAGDRRRGTRGA